MNQSILKKMYLTKYHLLMVYACEASLAESQGHKGNVQDTYTTTKS